VASGHYLVIDAGTGLRGLEAVLPTDGGLEFTIILTHYHWGHIQGLPMFGPLADRHNRFTFYGRPYDGRDIGDMDLRHPQGAVGFRLDGPSRSIMIATDHEGGDPGIDAALIDLASGVDVLVHDAQYTEDEVAGDRRGWGHSSWAQAAAAANSCGAGRLVLTSHDPGRADDRVEDLVRLARVRFPLTTGAYEGLRLPL
jgi:phosphoribosyl 1,2-cyclic phosphodiesterase